MHWVNGGSTDLDNLVSLCGYHHRLVHDGGWKIQGDPNGELIFIRPDGRPYQPRPQPIRREVRQRLVEPVGGTTVMLSAGP
ncbi:MAG: HNH endonuclease signature motif containing protein [Acidimicrobiia bacterium]